MIIKKDNRLKNYHLYFSETTLNFCWILKSGSQSCHEKKVELCPD